MAITNKGQFKDRNVSSMKKDNIWLTTGVCAPDSGSTNPAKLNPVLAAIFSPASSAEPNNIFNNKPLETPITSS